MEKMKNKWPGLLIFIFSFCFFSANVFAEAEWADVTFEVINEPPATPAAEPSDESTSPSENSPIISPSTTKKSTPSSIPSQVPSTPSSISSSGSRNIEGDNRRATEAIYTSREVFGGDYFFESQTDRKGDPERSLYLRDYAGNGPGEVQFRNMLEALFGFAKKILVPIIIILCTWAGFELLFARGKEDTFTNKRRQMFSIAVGFGLILLATVIVEGVFFGESGRILVDSDSSGYAKKGYSEIMGIVKYIETFVAVTAIGFIVYGGFKLIMGGENDDQISQIKKQLTWAAVGIIVIVGMRTIVDFFTAGGRWHRLDPGKFDLIYGLILRWTNIVLSFIGILAVIALIWAGIRMITQFGDENAVEESKKIIQYAVIALILAFSVYTIAHYFMLPAGM